MILTGVIVKFLVGKACGKTHRMEEDMQLGKQIKKYVLIPLLCVGLLWTQFANVIPVVCGDETTISDPEITGNKVEVNSMKIEWAGNNGGQDFLLIYLGGATYTSYNIADNADWTKFASYIYVNGISLTESGLTAWAQRGMYGDSTCYSVWLNRNTQYSLKNDGTDIIEIRQGCQFTMENGSDYYVTGTTAKFQSPSINGTGITSCRKVFEYQAEVEYDATTDVIVETVDNSVGEQKICGLTIANLDAWGLTKFAAYTPNNLEKNDIVQVKFVVPIDSSIYGKVKVKLMYNNPSTFCAYGEGETEKVSFQTTTNVMEVTLDTETLAVAGKVSSIFFQLQDANPAQFFVDSVMLLEKEVEIETPFSYQSNVEYDADSNIFLKDTNRKIESVKTRPWAGQGDVGIGTKCVLYTSGSNEENHLQQNDAVVLELVHPIDVSQFKTVQLKVLVGAIAEFRVFGEGSTNISFTTDGTVQTLSLDAESFADKNGKIQFFAFQLVSAEAVQLFVDSLILQSEAMSKPFTYRANKLYDANESVFVTAQDDKIGKINLKATYVEDLDNWGMTNYAYYTSDPLSRGDALAITFKHAIDASKFKTIHLTVFYNASAGFYVYKNGTKKLNYSNARQSFELSGGVETIKLSSELFADEDGMVRQMIVQLQTMNAQQFFVDGFKLSKRAYKPDPVEKFKIKYAYHETEISEVKYTREYTVGLGQDILWLYFTDNITKDSNEGVTLQDLTGISDHIVINGQMVGEQALYAIAGLWHNPNAVAIFLDSSADRSINNDGYDSLSVLAGFELNLEKAKNNVAVYKVNKKKDYYFNAVLEDGVEYILENSFNPPETDRTAFQVYSVEAEYGKKETVLTISFDKKFGAVTAENEKKIKKYVRINGTMLSEIENSSLESDGSNLRIHLPSKVLKNNGKDVLELLVGLGVSKGEKGVTLKEKRVYRSVDSKAVVWYCDSEENLAAYYIAKPVVQDGIVQLNIKTSYNNHYRKNFNSSVLSHIKINGKGLSGIIKSDENNYFCLSGKSLVIGVSKSYLKDGLQVTLEKGFKVPEGATLKEKVSFVYDSEFERFDAKRVKFPDTVQTRNVNVDEIVFGTDGVAEGTTQIFVKFNNIVCGDYLPSVQLGAYGLSEVRSVIPTMNASDTYISQLDKYGMISSVMDNILLDGKSVREWISKDKDQAGSDWGNSIQVNYIGSVFNPYYLQICLNQTSSSVMDESIAHEIVFKKGFITPEFGVLGEDVSFVWDAEAELWSKVNESIPLDTYVEAKDTDYWNAEEMTYSGQMSGIVWLIPVIVAALLAVGTVVTISVVRKRRRCRDEK